jgi:hypothetical protein
MKKNVFENNLELLNLLDSCNELYKYIKTKSRKNKPNLGFNVGKFGTVQKTVPNEPIEGGPAIIPIVLESEKIKEVVKPIEKKQVVKTSKNKELNKSYICNLVETIEFKNYTRYIYKGSYFNTKKKKSIDFVQVIEKTRNIDAYQLEFINCIHEVYNNRLNLLEVSESSTLEIDNLINDSLTWYNKVKNK